MPVTRNPNHGQSTSVGASLIVTRTTTHTTTSHDPQIHRSVGHESHIEQGTNATSGVLEPTKVQHPSSSSENEATSEEKGWLKDMLSHLERHSQNQSVSQKAPHTENLGE